MMNRRHKAQDHSDGVPTMVGYAVHHLFSSLHQVVLNMAMQPDVVQIIFHQRHQVLLGFRQNTGVFDQLWGFPSGRVEAGETLSEAAVRESIEEVGVRPLQLEPLLRINDAASERYHHIFLCTAWSGTLQNLEPHLCRELRWFELGTLPTVCTPVTYAIWPAINAYLAAGSANFLSEQIFDC